MEDETFDIVMRGYDRDQVDKTLDEMRREIEHLSGYNESSAAEITLLKAEIENVKAIAANGPGSYTALGAQFEQTLRLAEEQAKKMLADAAQEALRIREEAKGESEQVKRTAKDRAERAALEAEIKFEEARLEADRKHSEMLSTRSWC